MTRISTEIGCKILIRGCLAERSKALALGASPRGRGFESHSSHIFISLLIAHLLFDIQSLEKMVFLSNKDFGISIKRPYKTKCEVSLRIRLFGRVV